MTRRLALTAAIVIVIGISFITTGYAYTSMTENSSNNASSEYVVLELNGYTFSTDDLALDVISTDAGTTYRLVGGYKELIDIDGKRYYGAVIGEDRLLATRTVDDDTPMPITISSPTVDGGWFADFSSKLQDWRYVLEVKNAVDDENPQYTYYDGSVGGQWKYPVGESLSIIRDTTYYLTLYLAAPGVDSVDSLRAVGGELKVSSDLVLTPVWAAKNREDKLNYTLKANGGTGTDHVVYIQSDSDLVLTENIYTRAGGYVFVGWLDDDMGKTFTPFHVYKNNSGFRTFKAQWEPTASTDNYRTITFNGGTGATGSMADEYVRINNTYSLPMCKFVKSGYAFTGWTVTGTSDYSNYTQPMTDIPRVTENLTLTANWEEMTFEREVTLTNGAGTSFILYTDIDGRYTLPANIFASPADIDDERFNAWEFVGWSVSKSNSKKVAQSYTVPTGKDGFIAYNGMIRFAYDNDLVNEEEE